MGKWQSTTFKLNAVEKALGRREDETLEQVAQQIGIGYSTLTRWMTQVNAGKLTATATPATASARRPEDWSIDIRDTHPFIAGNHIPEL
jgi:transposase-like protein